MMMEPFGGTTLTLVLIHAGFALTACAFLLRDILWLRIFAILANLSVALAAYRMLPEPNWVALSWASAFVLINLSHSAWLIYERHIMTFTAEEQRLYDAAFEALDRTGVKRLLRRGTWTDFADRDCLVRQGVHLERLILVAEGEAAVLLGGRVVARLGPGKFVGEISFLSGDLATATVVAAGPLRCLVWDRSALDKLLARRPELRGVVLAAIGKDLAAKTAAHNLTLAEA